VNGEADTRPTILIAEDEPTLRNLLHKILAKQGYHVLVAKDGHEALCIANEHNNSIDMLVTDIQMPGMAGQELAKELKRLVPRIRILLVSGFFEGALQLDEDWSFLKKPYSPREIVDRVRQSLEDAAHQA
jgi:two-component system, cell cycle sensor histidine kinase and response regulator CckA